MDFAQITFQGRLTSNPELRESSSGTPICKFFVATNRRIGKGDERTTYIPTTVFGKQADICAKYLGKGREVLVTGDFESDKYTDSDGNKRTGFGCIARNVIFGRGGAQKTEDEEIGDLSEEEKKRGLSEYIKGSRNR